MIRRANPPPKVEEKPKKQKEEKKKIVSEPVQEIVKPVQEVKPEPKKEENKKTSEWDGLGLSGGLENLHVRKFRGLVKEHGQKVGELLLNWIKEYNIKNPSKYGQ